MPIPVSKAEADSIEKMIDDACQGPMPAGGFMATEAQKQELKEKVGDLVEAISAA